MQTFNRPVYVVNPGLHDRFTGDLTQNGEAQIEKAGAKLAEMISGEMIIVCATDSRTTESAHIIGDLNNAASIVEAPEVDRASDNVELIGDDLPAFLSGVLHKHGINDDENAAIVFVGHAPAAAAAKGLPQMATATGAVAPGEVVAYDASNWYQPAA